MTPLLRTEKQAEASRVNGSKSHGPVTPAGKQRASMNAYTHGGYARALVLPWEGPAALDRTVQDYVDTIHPCNPVEYRLTVSLAHADFRLQRACVGEDANLSRNVRAAPGAFDQDEKDRANRLFGWLKDLDDSEFPLTVARQLDDFLEGVRRQIRFWTELVELGQWVPSVFSIALPLLKKLPGWMHSDEEVGRLVRLIAAGRERADRESFCNFCRECGAAYDWNRLEGAAPAGPRRTSCRPSRPTKNSPRSAAANSNA